MHRYNKDIKISGRAFPAGYLFSFKIVSSYFTVMLVMCGFTPSYQ